MIDVKRPLRKAYIDLLDGYLSYNAVNVPVSTDIKQLADASALNYVIVSSQYGVDSSTFQSFDSDETLVIDICSKGKTRPGREAVDDIAGQIMNKVLPAPAKNGLPIQPNVQIDCVRLDGDRYLALDINPGSTISRRILTFTHKVRQLATYEPQEAPFFFKSPVTELDFSDATTYNNASIKLIDYDLYLNGTKFLAEDIEWTRIVNGGFQILIPGFDATAHSYSIYIIRK